MTVNRTHFHLLHALDCFVIGSLSDSISGLICQTAGSVSSDKITNHRFTEISRAAILRSSQFIGGTSTFKEEDVTYPSSWMKWFEYLHCTACLTSRIFYAKVASDYHVEATLPNVIEDITSKAKECSTPDSRTNPDKIFRSGLAAEFAKKAHTDNLSVAQVARHFGEVALPKLVGLGLRFGAAWGVSKSLPFPLNAEVAPFIITATWLGLIASGARQELVEYEPKGYSTQQLVSERKNTITKLARNIFDQTDEQAGAFSAALENMISNESSFAGYPFPHVKSARRVQIVDPQAEAIPLTIIAWLSGVSANLAKMAFTSLCSTIKSSFVGYFSPKDKDPNPPLKTTPLGAFLQTQRVQTVNPQAEVTPPTSPLQTTSQVPAPEATPPATSLQTISPAATAIEDKPKYDVNTWQSQWESEHSKFEDYWDNIKLQMRAKFKKASTENRILIYRDITCARIAEEPSRKEKYLKDLQDKLAKDGYSKYQDECQEAMSTAKKFQLPESTS